MYTHTPHSAVHIHKKEQN